MEKKTKTPIIQKMVKQFKSTVVGMVMFSTVVMTPMTLVTQ